MVRRFVALQALPRLFYELTMPSFQRHEADFLNGWDKDILQKAIDECTDDSGVIDKCAVFDLYDYSDLSTNRCQQEPFLDEQTSGILEALPGNNPYTPGPERITMQAEDSPPSVKEEVTIFGGAVANHTVKANIEEGSADTSEASSTGEGESSATKSSSAGGSATKGTATGTTKADATASSKGGSSGGSTSGSSSSGTTKEEDNSSESGSSDLPLGLSTLQWGLIGGAVVFLIMGGVM